MGFAWPIVYMRARRLYDSPRRPYQLKYFHGDSPAALCAACAAPYLDRNAGSNVHSWRYSAIFHTTWYTRSLWMDGYFPGMEIFEDIFSSVSFFASREDCYWDTRGMDETSECEFAGRGYRLGFDWGFRREILLSYYKVYTSVERWAFEIVWSFYSRNVFAQWENVDHRLKRCCSL